MSKPYRFHEGHYHAFKILLAWCVEKYKKLNSPLAKQMWNNDIRFLAKMQKEQFYTEKQRQELNKIRRNYLTEKKIDEYEIGGTKNPI
jgi:Spy/CpxP family protein refolding chaperone